MQCVTLAFAKKWTLSSPDRPPDIPLDPAHRVEKRPIIDLAQGMIHIGKESYDTLVQGMIHICRESFDIYLQDLKLSSANIGHLRYPDLFYVLLLAHNLNHIMMAIYNLFLE